MADNTDTTAAKTDTTDNSGQSDAAAETTNQDPTIARLQEYEQKLTHFSNLERERQELEQTAKAAQAEALRWQSSYRSLQSSTTASLQEAARTRQEQTAQQRIHDELAQARAEMSQVREGLAFLATRMGDEDSVKEFQLRQREVQLQQMEEVAKQRMTALQAAAQQQQSPPQRQFTDPSDEKRQFLDYYFPDSGVDHSNPAIDWGEGAPDTREAFRRFTTSVMKLREESTPGKPPVQSEVAQLITQLQKDREELQRSHEQALEDLKVQNRRDVEERLRKVGADAGNGSSVSQSTAKAQTRLNELDESALSHGEPAARAKAAKNMETELRALRDQLIRQQ